MAKIIQFDLSGADEDVWEQGESIDAEPPKKGIYQARVKEINPGFSKGDDGKPDKKRPRLEVVWEIIGDSDGDADALATLGHEGGSCLSAWVWDYVSFSDASEWKQAQFFKTLGVANPKKTKGKFDAEKFEGKFVAKIRVKADTNLDGDYKAKVAATWPWEDADPDTSDIDDELADELADTEEWDKESLGDLELAELKNVARQFDVEVAKGKKKNTYIKEILAAQEEADEDEDEEDLEDDELDLEDDEEEEEEGLTEEDIREMDASELKALAKDNGISLKGMKKSEAIDHLISELVEDEVPF